MKKRLSERADFSTSLILSADYASNPGVNGECELGVRWLKSKTEIWQWNDEWGSEVFATLPVNATMRQIVEEVLHDDRYPSSVSLDEIVIVDDRPPLGHLLSLLWVDDQSYRNAVALLLRLTDSDLLAISLWNDDGILSDEILDALQEVSEYLDGIGVEVDELSNEISLQAISPEGVQEAFKLDGALVEQTAKEASAAREVQLKPFIADIQRITAAWDHGKRGTRLPGGAVVPPAGAAKLRHFLEAYILIEKKLPSGVHQVPGGRGWMGREEPPFDVDFDALQGRANQGT